MRPIRVLLIDQGPIFLEAAECFLKTREDVEVVARVRLGAEALARAEQLHADVVLFEPFSVADGLRFVEQLRVLPKRPMLVILTDHEEPPYRELAARAKVDGYILKRDFCTQISALLDDFDASRLEGDEASADGGTPHVAEHLEVSRQVT